MRFSRHLSQRLANWLTLLLLLQAALPAQAHTVLEQDENGMLHQVCVVDAQFEHASSGGDGQNDDIQEHKRYSAVVFSELAAELLPGLSYGLEAANHADAPFRKNGIDRFYSRSLSLRTIRGPPSLSLSI